MSDLDDNVLFRPSCINVEYAPRRLLRQGAHSGPKKFLAQLKRRNAYRAAVAYSICEMIPTELD